MIDITTDIIDIITDVIDITTDVIEIITDMNMINIIVYVDKTLLGYYQSESTHVNIQTLKKDK